MAQQIEPIEFFGTERKGEYLRVFAFPLVEDNKVQAVIYDKDDNVLFSYMLIAESYDDVAEQLKLTLIEETKQERMYSEAEVNFIIAEVWNSCEDNEDGETFTQMRKRVLEQFKNKELCTKSGKVL